MTIYIYIYIYIYIFLMKCGLLYIFNPSFENFMCLATLKSCDTTK